MKLTLFLAIISTAASFAPSSLIVQKQSLQNSVEHPTVAFLFGRGKKEEEDANTVVLERPEEEMMKLNGQSEATPVATAEETSAEPEKEQSETEKLLAKVKAAGTAGVISYAAWELAFWAISLPVVILGYKGVTGHFPDFQNSEDMAKLGAEAFAFVNFARFAVPLRIGLALSTTPWIQENVVDKFKKEDSDAQSEGVKPVEQEQPVE